MVSAPEQASEAVLWRRLDGWGMEHCRLSERHAETIVDGVVLVSHVRAGLSSRTLQDGRASRADGSQL